jgi:hypothetical protein
LGSFRCREQTRARPYSGADTVALTADDAHLVATGTADGEVSVSGGKALFTRVITIDNITGQGTLTVAIDPGTSWDAAGNYDLGLSGTVEVFGVAPATPVGGVVLLGLLAGACALSGVAAMRRKK